MIAIRPTLPRSRTLAMPCVTVQKMISPTTIWMSRMKMSPNGLRLAPHLRCERTHSHAEGHAGQYLEGEVLVERPANPRVRPDGVSVDDEFGA